jgi:hypothetical protein
MFRYLILAACLTAALPALADWSEFARDLEEDNRPWQEADVKLPAPPKAADLIPFVVSPTSSNRYFVDFASLSVGADDVVRYTALVRTEGGAENVSYEGMRCETRERKLYAFGHPDGSWSRNRYARWEPIHMHEDNSYRRELYNSYFCTGGMGKPQLKRIQQMLRQGGYRP